MRKLLGIFMSLTMIMLVGCNKETESNLFVESVENGKIAIAEKDFEKASSMFALALDEKEDDEISKLKKQCDLALEVKNMDLKYEDVNEQIKDYQDNKSNELIDKVKEIKDELTSMINVCDEIIAIETESNIVVDIVKKYKSDFEDIIKNLEIVETEYNEMLKQEQEKAAAKAAAEAAKPKVYECVICFKDTTKFCPYDGCYPLCEDDTGYYCDCGEVFHHTQNLCELYDY